MAVQTTMRVIRPADKSGPARCVLDDSEDALLRELIIAAHTMGSELQVTTELFVFTRAVP